MVAQDTPCIHIPSMLSGCALELGMVYERYTYTCILGNHGLSTELIMSCSLLAYTILTYGYTSLALYKAWLWLHVQCMHMYVQDNHAYMRTPFTNCYRCMTIMYKILDRIARIFIEALCMDTLK
jgi:hypothetical protein